jgi:hypothetical protein
MNSSISSIFLYFVFCVIPLGIGLIVVLKLRDKHLSTLGIQSTIQMDGATFQKTNEGNITVKRRTIYTWLLTVFFGAAELVVLGLAVSLVSGIIKSKGTPETVSAIIFSGLLFGAVLFQNILTLRLPSIIHFNTNSRILEIGHGFTKQQLLFSQISKIWGSTRPTPLQRIERIDLRLILDNGKLIELGGVTGYDALSRASAIARQISEVTGAAILNPSKP